MSQCRRHRNLTIALVSICGAACEDPAWPPTCETHHPPTVTQFALLTDTVFVSDTSGNHPDTLMVSLEIQGDSAISYLLELEAVTPLGNNGRFSSVARNGVNECAFRLNHARYDTAGAHFTPPEPGSYLIWRLAVSYAKQVCHNYYLGTTTDWGNVSLGVWELRELGLESDSFAVVYDLPPGNPPPDLVRR